MSQSEHDFMYIHVHGQTIVGPCICMYIKSSSLWDICHLHDIFISKTNDSYSYISYTLNIFTDGQRDIY